MAMCFLNVFQPHVTSVSYMFRAHSKLYSFHDDRMIECYGTRRQLLAFVSAIVVCNLFWSLNCCVPASFLYAVPISRPSVSSPLVRVPLVRVATCTLLLCGSEIVSDL